MRKVAATITNSASVNEADTLKSNWNSLWWIGYSLSLAVTAPLLIYRTISYIKLTRSRGILQGKVVVITGASSGLGEALAHAFYQAGCQVVLTARREDELERVRKDLLETHSKYETHPPVVVPLDLADLNSLPKKVAKILEIFGHIDILVNNGGISVRSDVISSAIDVDLKVMMVNYFGSVAMTKAVLPSMVQRKMGKIVFVSSVQGKIALPYRSAYSASKHALGAFSDSLRAEVCKDNVKVLAVSPGYINTALSLNALTSTGASYGMTDSTTANGMSPERAAEDILKAVILDKKDVVMAPVYIRIFALVRSLLPCAYFWLMDRRAGKMARLELKESCKND